MTWSYHSILVDSALVGITGFLYTGTRTVQWAMNKRNGEGRRQFSSKGQSTVRTQRERHIVDICVLPRHRDESFNRSTGPFLRNPLPQIVPSSPGNADGGFRQAKRESLSALPSLLGRHIVIALLL
jgi:hypothetical protein